jgi:hypothetical protein
MHQRPDANQLLIAIQRFLARDVAPELADRALKFRALIAGHLLGQIERELGARDELDAAERDGLVHLLGDAAADHLGGPDEVTALRAELARRIRTSELSGPALADTRAHLLETLAGALSVINPKFDVRHEIE